MSRKHKDRTPEERKKIATETHAKNRLSKLDGVISRVEDHLSVLKAERKRLKAS